jgi:non-ribosomal peptide synthetase component F
VGAAPEGGFGEHRVRLSEEATAEIHAFARLHRLTPSCLAQGVWALLLSHASGARDVVFGVTVSGRPADLPGIESMAGVFINNLPLRVSVPAAERLVPWLHEIQRRQADLQQHESSALVDVQGWSVLPRGVSLFDSILTFQNFPLESLPGEPETGLAIVDPQAVEVPHYPLALAVDPAPRWSLRISYDRRRFGDAAIERMASRFEALLRACLAGPEATLQSLQSALGETEALHAIEKERELAAASLEMLRRTRRQGVRVVGESR